MNARQFSIALLISALPILASAENLTAFNSSDFVAVKRVEGLGGEHSEGDISVKLSKSGKAKLKKFTVNSVSAAKDE